MRPDKHCFNPMVAVAALAWSILCADYSVAAFYTSAGAGGIASQSGWGEPENSNSYDPQLDMWMDRFNHYYYSAHQYAWAGVPDTYSVAGFAIASVSGSVPWGLGAGASFHTETQFALTATSSHVVLPWHLAGAFQLANAASQAYVNVEFSVSAPPTYVFDKEWISYNYSQQLPGWHTSGSGPKSVEGNTATFLGDMPSLVLDGVTPGTTLNFKLSLSSSIVTAVPSVYPGFSSGTSYSAFEHTASFDWTNAVGVNAPEPTRNVLTGPNPAEIPDAPATVPEPSALLVWSSLATVGLIAGWRKRKRGLASP